MYLGIHSPIVRPAKSGRVWVLVCSGKEEAGCKWNKTEKLNLGVRILPSVTESLGEITAYSKFSSSLFLGRRADPPGPVPVRLLPWCSPSQGSPPPRPVSCYLQLSPKESALWRGSGSFLQIRIYSMWGPQTSKCLTHDLAYGWLRFHREKGTRTTLSSLKLSKPYKSEWGRLTSVVELKGIHFAPHGQDTEFGRSACE